MQFEPTPHSPIAMGERLRESLVILPCRRMGTFPSPVRRLGLAGNIWIKDESAVCPAYGGNKVRKWERMAPTLHGRPVVLWGDAASHNLHAGAILGLMSGLDMQVVVYGKSTADDHAGMASLRASGVHLLTARGFFHAAALARWRAWRQGGVVVPLGSTTPLTCAAWSEAALELDDHVTRGEMPAPHAIYVAMGSGGTVAGLLVGLACSRLETRIVAVRAVQASICSSRHLRRLVAQTVAHLKLPSSLTAAAWSHLERIDESQLGRGYRDETPAAQKAVQAAQSAGLSLEGAFTGKAFAALLADVTKRNDQPLLFWNTHTALATPP